MRHAHTMARRYRDRLIESTGADIRFRFYGFPYGDRHVAWSDIEGVGIRVPGLGNGSGRIWGTGDFGTWFPLDWARPRRERIFIAALGRGLRIGFAVEDAAQMSTSLRRRGLLQAAPG